MKDIVIFGAGGFGREIQWLIERINEKEERWNLLGYIDDGIKSGTLVDGYPVLGGSEYLLAYEKELSVACAVGTASTRKKIIENIKKNDCLKFPVLIDPSVILSKRVQIGEGVLICAGTIITVDVEIGDFTHINLDCTLGHDAVIKEFVTIYPSVNISGCVTVGEQSEVGTGSHVIQGVSIGNHTIVGAGAVVIRELPSDCTAVGNPAKKIK